MDLFEAQDFFKNMHPNKNIKYEFDMNCLRQMEIIHTDGLPHDVNHVEYRKVKVTVEGMDPTYVPIAPHRAGIMWDEIKKYVVNQDKVFKHPNIT